jgi:hypothetical protein
VIPRRYVSQYTVLGPHLLEEITILYFIPRSTVLEATVSPRI